MTERGFATPVTLALLGLLAMFCLAFGDAAAVLTAKVRASNAADAAALSASVEQWKFLSVGTDPLAAASRSADSNGAELESCDCPVRGTRAIVVVTVRTGAARLSVAPAEVRATARATVDVQKLFRPPD